MDKTKLLAMLATSSIILNPYPCNSEVKSIDDESAEYLSEDENTDACEITSKISYDDYEEESGDDSGLWHLTIELKGKTKPNLEIAIPKTDFKNLIVDLISTTNPKKLIRINEILSSLIRYKTGLKEELAREFAPYIENTSFFFWFSKIKNLELRLAIRSTYLDRTKGEELPSKLMKLDLTSNINKAIYELSYDEKLQFPVIISLNIGEEELHWLVESEYNWNNAIGLIIELPLGLTERYKSRLVKLISLAKSLLFVKTTTLYEDETIKNFSKLLESLPLTRDSKNRAEIPTS